MKEKALPLIKAQLGISTNVRDDLLTAILNGIVAELKEEKGLSLSDDNPYHLMFVVDFSVWRYKNREEKGMPEHLYFRLRNLMIHGAKSGVTENDI